MGEGQVQESLHHTVRRDPILRRHKGFAELFSSHMRRCAGHACEGEDHHGAVSFKFRARGLDLDLSVGWTLAKSGFKRVEHSVVQASVKEMNHASSERSWEVESRGR